MKFELPAVLPKTVAELNKLRDEALAEITAIQTAYDEGGEMSADDLAYLTDLLDAVDTLNSESTKVALLDRSRAATAEPEGQDTDDDGDSVDTDDDETPEGGPESTADAGLVAGSPDGRPIKFSGLGASDAPDAHTGPGWVVAPGAPGFDANMAGKKVGFAQMGKALANVRKGHIAPRPTDQPHGSKLRQAMASLNRGLPVVADEQALVAAILEQTNEKNLPGGSLVAAGGWTSPSVQLYDFCDVPDATDLVSLPGIVIERGGLRWPVEPDLTSLFEHFEFFFTEPELEAVDGQGHPTAFKHSVEIPAPEEFREIRLNAVGWSVTAGILQRQAWPESVEYVLRALTQEHFRAMSRRRIRDMWNGGNPVKIFDANLQVGGTSGVLNAIALYATNLRLHRGLGRTATIEGIAPSWFFEVLRADMAMQQGIDTKSVPDSQVLTWLSDRHVVFQFAGDWQTRGKDQPGHLDTLRWPGHVDIIMYPAGTWFESLSNIIEIGVQYPRELVQINRYSEFFTEDAIAIGKRCGVSANLRIPLKVNGGYGAQVTITHTDTLADFGGSFDATAPGGSKSGQAGLPTGTTLTISGDPTAGNFKLGYLGEDTAPIDVAGITKDTIKAALVALDDNLGADDFTVTGSGASFTITARGGGKVTVTAKALTGGTNPDVVAS